MMRDGVRRFTIVLILRATTGDSLPCPIATVPLHPYPNLRFDAKYLR